MASWDKLMALPKQQYPSFKALRKRQKAEPYGNVEALIDHKKTDLEFPKHAVPLGQLMPVSDQNIESIAVHYAGMRIAPTNVYRTYFLEVMNFSHTRAYGPDSNLLVDNIGGDTDMANFRIPPERFSEFVALLNNIRTWRYPNPRPDYDAQQHRLAVAITYRDGTKWALGSNMRFLKDKYLEAMIAPDLESKRDEYDFVYISLRDVVLLMQHLDDRVPVFLKRYDDPPYSVNERRQWKELLDQP